MYSLFAKKENAHEEAIWTCDWNKIQDGDDGIVDVIATGGVDDVVKVGNGFYCYIVRHQFRQLRP